MVSADVYVLTVALLLGVFCAVGLFVCARYEGSSMTASLVLAGSGFTGTIYVLIKLAEVAHLA